MALLVRLYKDTVITPAARDCGSPISTVTSVMISHYHPLSPPSPQPSPAQPAQPSRRDEDNGGQVMHQAWGRGHTDTNTYNHVDYLRMQGNSRLTQIKESNPLLYL